MIVFTVGFAPEYHSIITCLSRAVAMWTFKRGESLPSQGGFIPRTERRRQTEGVVVPGDCRGFVPRREQIQRYWVRGGKWYEFIGTTRRLRGDGDIRSHTGFYFPFLMFLAKKMRIFMFLMPGHISCLMGKELPNQNSDDMDWKRTYTGRETHGVHHAVGGCPWPTLSGSRLCALPHSPWCHGKPGK